jgi:prolyl-tRNA editing enzyme YbaK/EbsC (Cys-tRNA(Pro) deacylase)
VLVAGKRGEDERVAACVVPASTFADVNKRVRKLLDVRKASFLPMDRAVADSGMEYGGITPVGLPEGYRVLVDSRFAEPGTMALMGSGVRRSKLLMPGPLLCEMPGVEVTEDLGTSR